MKRYMLILLWLLLGASQHAAAQQKVDAKGIKPNVKLEEVVYGHLNELNGKFKFRVTEVAFEPGAHLGAHHHAGPGIRYVASGTLTFVQAGKGNHLQAGGLFLRIGERRPYRAQQDKAAGAGDFFRDPARDMDGPFRHASQVK